MLSNSPAGSDNSIATHLVSNISERDGTETLLDIDSRLISRC